jgi:AcrR family transcriptional regulator
VKRSPPSATGRAPAQRREELLDAALRCFGERGVLRTGIEDVRKAAGASPSSVYHFFDGLPGVVSALLERTFARLFAHLAAKVTEAVTAEAAVRALVAGHLGWVRRHPEEARFMYQATALELAPGASEGLAARKAEMLRPIVAHLAPFAAAGQLPAWPPLALDVVLLGPSHEACRRWLAGAPLDPRWMAATLPELAWRSVAPAAASVAQPIRDRRFLSTMPTSSATNPSRRSRKK